jgi:hypothetical protein
MFNWLKRTPAKVEEIASYPKDQLTIRILANVDDVDPDFDLAEFVESAEEATRELPTIEFVEELFLDRIGAMLCLEGEQTLQWLTESDIASWQVSREDLFAVAMENLNEKAREAQLHTMRQGDGGVVHAVLCEGVTLSSLILARNVLPQFGFSKADVAAAIPNRDSFLFCDRRSTESCEYLRKLVDVWWEDEDCPKKYRITKSLLSGSETALFGWIPIEAVH